MDNYIHSALERDERISRYIKGQMDAHEEAIFLADMESDEQLKQDALAQARLIIGMRQVDNEIINALKTEPESTVISSIKPRKALFRRATVWLSIAASVVVLFFAGYKGYDYYETTRLGMKYATAFPMETLARGDSDMAVESELQTLFNNVVDRKELSTTTERLSELWEISNQETYNDYTDYAPYIGWHLAIGYLEDYEKEKAIRVLREIAATENVSIVISQKAKYVLHSVL